MSTKVRVIVWCGHDMICARALSDLRAEGSQTPRCKPRWKPRRNRCRSEINRHREWAVLQQEHARRVSYLRRSVVVFGAVASSARQGLAVANGLFGMPARVQRRSRPPIFSRKTEMEAKNRDGIGACGLLKNTKTEMETIKPRWRVPSPLFDTIVLLLVHN